MTPLSLTVNGAPVQAAVEPRTPLADFLREQMLLTGTHVGCAQGVCGACTVLLDGEPARSCITFAAVCEGRDVRSVEGLEDDPAAIALRAAFSAEHALQCGYCTPGMLVTARDIVLRLPDADDDRIRLELAGNLCRCTGYLGIVRAIRRVLDARLNLQAPVAAPAPAARFAALAEAAGPVLPAGPSASASAMPGGSTLRQEMRLALPADAVWAALQDPALVAGCVPGARLLSVEDGRVRGEMAAALGPIRARFAGDATLSFDDAQRSGRIAGDGRDATSGTRLSGEAEFRVEADGPAACRIVLDVAYALRGPLAQFSRGPVVQVFAAEVAAAVARNLEGQLRGEPAAPARLGAGLFLRVLWRALRRLVSQGDA